MSDSVRIYTAARPHTEPAEPTRADRRRRGPRLRPKVTLSRADRLLRNTAVACALLLSILALGNLDLPWAKRAAEGVRQALTMRIELDESIGELTFVKELMPESALVFLNVSGAPELARPVLGEVTHPWSSAQPWLMFGCPAGTQVAAAADGTVTAVSPLSGGKTGVLVDHGDGLETTYANLDRAEVSAGDAVRKGQALGTCGDSLYFEYRANGEPVDPSEKLGLR